MIEHVCRWPRLAACLVAGSAMLVPLHLAAQTTAAPATTVSGLNLGLVLDGAYVSDELALGSRAKGLGLGHTELTANADVDDWFRGQVAAALHSHEGELELELEEAYLETLAWPAGLTVRGGRFLSQIGYLNGQHPHADDFAERPLLYRAFLGTHYFDDGVRLNYLLPTSLFWQFGVEAFSGRSLIAESVNKPSIGALTLSTRLGGDIGASQSWQFGLGLLRNRRQALGESEADDAGDEHDHDHGAGYSGENMLLADLAWKWAPDGNNRSRQLRVSAEYARITDLNEFASDDDRHEAWYLSAVYRFSPQWESGIRFGDLKVATPHGDHFHDGHLQETSVMVAYKRSEFSAFRLQYTSQNSKKDFADATDSLMLQYVVSMGAHGAHSF